MLSRPKAPSLPMVPSWNRVAAGADVEAESAVPVPVPVYSMRNTSTAEYERAWFTM